MNDIEIKFAKTLRVPLNLSEKKIHSLVMTRVIKLGHGKVCGRCGGCGNYSFNQVHGTRCYGCGGLGYKTPKLTESLLSDVKATVDSGVLDDYLKRIKLINAADKAVDIVSKAWSAIEVTKHYDWQLSARGVEPHKYIADTFNKPMYDCYKLVSGASSEMFVLTLKLKKAKTIEAKKEIESLIEEKAKQIDDLKENALNVINDTSIKLKEYLKNV
jgi:hypothetical protein